ncbi:hypothetical protein M758_8G190200 [Ceratodon purpureus]|uniref:Uncharacterized protein n=1 Tax=Ceratodon purpureus TaxID=3225 RepID=A0A8T0H2D8_CERPU|nr:hypothetical protein KC19_8G195200 [Ceratodon purpureus]KAG0609512.1 hypothetical protein M758_8G190200 [Ceratodon purpureus]
MVTFFAVFSGLCIRSSIILSECHYTVSLLYDVCHNITNDVCHNITNDDIIKLIHRMITMLL